jgi:hypothetical protein
MMKTKLIFWSTVVILAGLFGGCGSDNNSSESASLAQWYARTTVSAVNPDTQTGISHKTAGVFGQLNESSEGKDPHDIIGMGTESATLEVVFPQSEWDDDNGDYFSDYHSVKEGRDSWIFQVKNMNNNIDLSNEAITIALDGVYTVESTSVNGSTRYSEKLNRADERLDELTLIDLDNKVAYAVSELPTSEISMDGRHTRTFRWVLGAVTEEDYRLLSTSVAAKTFKMSSEIVSNRKFGLPPQ